VIGCDKACARHIVPTTRISQERCNVLAANAWEETFVLCFFRKCCDCFSSPQWVTHELVARGLTKSFDRLARKSSYLIAIRLMPLGTRPSTIFSAHFGCNEMVFFSGVSWLLLCTSKEVTRSLASESSWLQKTKRKAKKPLHRLRELNCEPAQHCTAPAQRGQAFNAPDAFALCVAMASINGGLRQS
jgi:hypothetical protein